MYNYQHNIASASVPEIGQANINAPAAPSIFTLELTTLCNNACSGCANIEVENRHTKQANPHKYMQNWREIIDTIAPYAKIIRLSGGEPTLHPEFIDIVKYIDTLGIKHALFTTGRWKHIKNNEVIETYKNCKNTAGMLISLHGASATTHNAFVETTESAWFETCQNIQNASKAGINVFVSCVLTKYACEEVDAIIEKGHSLGATCTVFNRFLSNDHPLLPHHTQLKVALETIQQRRQNGVPCRIGNSVPPCFLSGAIEIAKAGYELCHITTSGSMKPDNLASISFGSVFGGIETTWKNPMAYAYRTRINPACQQCAAFQQCRGGAKSLHHSPDCKDGLMTSAISGYALSSEPDPKDDTLQALTSD